MKKKRLISNIIGGLLQLIPAVYWLFTEGEKTIYEAFHFFPHYAVMLLLTVLMSVIQWRFNSGWLQTERSCAEEGLWCFLICFVWTVLGIFSQGSKAELTAFVMAVVLNGAAIFVYALLQTGLHWAVSQICGRMAVREGGGGK